MTDGTDWMFTFGTGGRSGGHPLACVAGGLIIDSGEEDATFVYRCQDRYPVYTALAGLRTVLFVLDDAHAQRYEDCLDDLRGRLGLVASRTGALESLDVLPPLYVGHDPATGALRAGVATRRALTTAPVRASIRAGLCCNQPSPSYARLLAALASICAEHGVDPAWDPAAVSTQADRCARAYDKADYVNLVARLGHAALAPHVPTAVVDADRVFACDDWPSLCALLPDHVAVPRRIHIKSTLDSGGNLAAAPGAGDFRAAIAGLRREWEAGTAGGATARRHMIEVTRRKVLDNWILGEAGVSDQMIGEVVDARMRLRSGRTVRFLIQPRVEPPAASVAPRIGCSFLIGDDGRATVMAVAQQVFADRDRMKHLGAVLSNAVDGAFAAAGAMPGFIELCAHYAAEGYRGPISFDAVMDDQGRYVGIYDCNPRLTAVFPALAVRRALLAEGAPCESIVNLGYRGLHTWPDPATRLDALDRAELLYTRKRGRGVLPVPNLARPNSFDLHLVNVDPSELARVLEEPLLGSAK